MTPSEALPQSTVSQGKRLVMRQALPTDFSTTTVFGPRPSYVTQACASGAYSSACLCANITTALVSYLGTVSKLVDVEGDWKERESVCNAKSLLGCDEYGHDYDYFFCDH